jgi:hypothetical protein
MRWQSVTPIICSTCRTENLPSHLIGYNCSTESLTSCEQELSSLTASSTAEPVVLGLAGAEEEKAASGSFVGFRPDCLNIRRGAVVSLKRPVLATPREQPMKLSAAFRIVCCGLFSLGVCQLRGVPRTRKWFREVRQHSPLLNANRGINCRSSVANRTP